jgi:hypothetical protein
MRDSGELLFGVSGACSAPLTPPPSLLPTGERGGVRGKGALRIIHEKKRSR